MSVGFMKVRLNSGRVGHVIGENGEFRGEFAQQIGDEVEMPTAEAKRYLDRGLASPIQEKKTKSEN